MSAQEALSEREKPRALWRRNVFTLDEVMALCLSIMNVAFEAAASKFSKKGGILRMSDALNLGISRKTLYAMRDAGKLEALSRGVYRLVALPALEAPDLVTVAARAPRGVICLISALAYHELTTQIPRAVDIAIEKGSRAPRISYPPINVYRFSGKAFTEGVHVVMIGGTRVRIYNPEKSVADAFKYRNKIGIDVAVEALRAWRRRRGSRVEKLLEQARNSRVEKVIRPYLEATT